MAEEVPTAWLRPRRGSVCAFPRRGGIAELVVWIGYLQQHYRTNSGHPGEPILKAFRNINFGRKDGYDAVLAWDGYPHRPGPCLAGIL